MSGSPEADLDRLRLELERTAEIPDTTEEMLEIAAIVAEALAPTGVSPIVVGGLAVAYWTTGVYLTADIDVVMPHGREIDERMAALGFEREGRFWTLRGRKPVLEAPAARLKLNPEGYSEVQLASGRIVRLQDVEEVLLVRLEEFVATGNADVFQQCLWLLGASSLDRERLQVRAEVESLSGALSAVDEIARKIEHDATTIELWEITDLAKSLRTMGT